MAITFSPGFRAAADRAVARDDADRPEPRPLLESAARDQSARLASTREAPLSEGTPADRWLDQLASWPAIVALMGLLAVALLGIPLGVLLVGHVELVLIAGAVALMAGPWIPIVVASSSGFQSLSWRWIFPALTCALSADTLEFVAFLL